MKNRLILILFSFCVSFYQLNAVAATCPAVDSFDPYNPPEGWVVSMPVVLPDQDYVFSRAVHFLDTAIYPQRVMCIYSTCSEPYCPAYSLLSVDLYNQPDHREAPWDAPNRLKGTVTCQPENHDPSVCVFQ